MLESYSNPLKTFDTNVMGTGNVLDALRRLNKKCIAVMITSDKCYDNVEWSYGYRETDRLGGKDPYSGSKVQQNYLFIVILSLFLKNLNRMFV